MEFQDEATFTRKVVLEHVVLAGDAVKRITLPIPTPVSRVHLQLGEGNLLMQVSMQVFEGLFVHMSEVMCAHVYRAFITAIVCFSYQPAAALAAGINFLC